MKATDKDWSKEFRRGNLIQCDGRFFEIDIIAEEFPVINTTEFGIGVIDWNNIKPIELTEEWLLKMGFIVNKNYKHPSFDEFIHSDFEDFGIGNFNDNYWVIDFLDQSFGSPEIKYVHQLQNLYFALTGEELTIK